MKIIGERRAYPLKTRIVAIIVTIFAVSFPAWASLGGDVTSVEADRAKMQATAENKTTQAYTVHEMRAPNGVVVREFVSPVGKVFGVAWQGPTLPDLRQVLGAYFDQFTRAVQEQRTYRAGHGPVVIHDPGLVVEMGGHMRSFVGRAYLPQMLPAGVQASEIR